MHNSTSGFPLSCGGDSIAIGYVRHHQPILWVADVVKCPQDSSGHDRRLGSNRMVIVVGFSSNISNWLIVQQEISTHLPDSYYVLLSRQG